MSRQLQTPSHHHNFTHCTWDVLPVVAAIVATVGSECNAERWCCRAVLCQNEELKVLRGSHEGDTVKLDSLNKDLVEMHKESARLKEQLQEMSKVVCVPLGCEEATRMGGDVVRVVPREHGCRVVVCRSRHWWIT